MDNKSKVGIGIGIGVGIAVGIVALVVVAVVATVFWGGRVFQDEVCPHLQNQAAIAQRVGVFTSCSYSLTKSGDVSDVDTHVFEVVGDKGQGDVYVMSTSTGPDGAEEYQGILLLIGSEEVLVFGERPPIQ